MGAGRGLCLSPPTATPPIGYTCQNTHEAVKSSSLVGPRLVIAVVTAQGARIQVGFMTGRTCKVRGVCMHCWFWETPQSVSFRRAGVLLFYFPSISSVLSCGPGPPPELTPTHLAGISKSCRSRLLRMGTNEKSPVPAASPPVKDASNPSSPGKGANNPSSQGKGASNPSSPGKGASNPSSPPAQGASSPSSQGGQADPITGILPPEHWATIAEEQVRLTADDPILGQHVTILMRL